MKHLILGSAIVVLTGCFYFDPQPVSASATPTAAVTPGATVTHSIIPSVSITPSATVTPPVSTVLSSDSSALSDNVFAVGTNFDSYSAFTLDIFVPQDSFVGERVFAKVVDAQFNTLFLGEISYDNQLNLPLQVVSNSFPLQVEIFTNSLNDEPMQQEISL